MSTHAADPSPFSLLLKFYVLSAKATAEYQPLNIPACTSWSFEADCYCGDKAPVWRTSDLYCDLPCEEDSPENDSDPNCGGWGFMTVFQIPKPVPTVLPSKPAAGADGVVTYKGCYDVKENSDILKKLVAKSDWMTNEVQWRPCTLCRQLELSFCTSQAARVRCILTEVSRVMGAGTKSRTPRGSTTTFVCPSAQS